MIYVYDDVTSMYNDVTSMYDDVTSVWFRVFGLGC